MEVTSFRKWSREERQDEGGDYVRETLKKARQDAGLTQKQVAELLFCDQSLYSKYERGERDLPLKLAIQLADFYHVSLDYLAGRTNRKQEY